LCSFVASTTFNMMLSQLHISLSPSIRSVPSWSFRNGLPPYRGRQKHRPCPLLQFPFSLHLLLLFLIPIETDPFANVNEDPAVAKLRKPLGEFVLESGRGAIAFCRQRLTWIEMVPCSPVTQSCLWSNAWNRFLVVGRPKASSECFM
jgi:hypothetical protein